ncbi:MAG: phosphoglycerate kinase [Patescibacteria group bacterium]
MQLKKIQDIDEFDSQRVLLRLDLNVPIKNGQVAKGGEERLLRSLPTIKYLRAQGAKIIIVAHLGRPEGRTVRKYSLRPVANKLSKMLRAPVEFWPGNISKYYSASRRLSAGQVVMLENIRFQPKEQKNCKKLAKRLSQLADIYVNDAFGNIHRLDSSMHAITYFLPSYAGFLLQDEVKYLSEVLATRDGLMVILGGAKVSTKIDLIKKFVQIADRILMGGAIANTLLAARGLHVGHSVYDTDMVDSAKYLLFKKVILPQDLVVCNTLNSKQCRTVPVDKVADKDVIVDLGPQTIKYYLGILKKAKLIVWNGPLGYFENSKGARASEILLKSIHKLPGKTIVGGGETVELVNRLKIKNKFTFVSTGGGAMLAFLQGDKLPVLERLII